MTRRGAAGQSLAVSPPVADALAAAAPVVALESTLIAHGLPYPLNLETAGEMMGAIRREGAVPALIAVLDGRIRIGLDSSGARTHRERRPDREGGRTRRPDPGRHRRQRRDGPSQVRCSARGWPGSRCSRPAESAACIRGASSTFDVSADLYELARTPVAVVCSGAKIHPRRPRHPGNARIPRCPGTRPRHHPVSRIPPARQRTARPPSGAGRLRGGSGYSGGARSRANRPGDRQPRSRRRGDGPRDRRAPRRTSRARRTRRERCRKGAHPVPSRRARRIERRRDVAHQPGSARGQCPRCGGGGSDILPRSASASAAV